MKELTPKLQLFLDFLMLTVGAAIAAFAIEEFLVPCTILDGGVIGIGIMVNNLTHIAPCVNATDQYLLAVCFGGVILGAGVGLVIRFGGCLDGTETVAILINRKFKLPVGQTVLIFNVIIYIVAALLFGFDRAMYSLLTYFVTSKIIDKVETGLEQAKAAMIITDEGKEIADQIYQKLGRTVTMLEGEGLISGKKVVLYCVLNRLEIYELKRLIKKVDMSAFITVSDVSEIIGKHIKKTAIEKAIKNE